jgi:WD40 repeat protein
MAKPLPPRPAGKARPSRKAKADPEDPDVLRRRGIYEKAKTFEERVAELFSLQGYRTTLDYQRDDMQFDVRVELTSGILPVHGLVECKDTDRPVTQQQVREFASKVEYTADADRLPYQGILIARYGFVNNAHEAARKLRILLRTYEELLRSLVDLRPMLDEAVRTFQGTALERLYVEQDIVFEADIQAGQEVSRKQLTPEILRWLEKPSGTFLALLGDFGCGKTSFSKRLASELAVKARSELATRVPVLIDLREGGSTTVTLENLLTHHFQRLSSQPFNPQALLQLNREGHLLLIFDGFDETIAYTEPGRYVENLRQILRAAEGKAKVLMTCRTHYFRDRPEALSRLGSSPAVVSTQGATRLYEEIQERPGAEIGYLMEFREEQISEYLRKALPPQVDWQAFREQIRQTYNLNDLAERPFLLEIIVKTLPRLAERQGNVTLADLYETYCESWFSHTDFRLTLTRDRRVALVEYLARLVWDSPENRVHYDLLFEKATEFFKDRSLTLHDKERIDYEVRTALFLHRDAEGYYSFIHRSFLEFFVARTLRSGLAADDCECLALRRITREVAFFLEFWPESKRIQELAGAVLATSYQPGVSENALLLLYFHARTTLGPLIGGEKEPNARQIREAFSKIRPKALRLEGADFEGAILPGIDLGSARLEGARLRRADLREASLGGARLVRADLAFADFRRGTAKSADLSGGDLNHLDAQEAVFQKAVLRNADLSFARMTKADLTEADLEGAQTVGTGLLGAQGVTYADLARTAGSIAPRNLDLRLQAGHSGIIRSVTWSPNGRCVATGSDDGMVKVWDAESGRALNSLEGHGDAVNSVAWSPDGWRLASGADDSTVRVWDAENGRALSSLDGHGHSVTFVAWSPDGRRLASGSSDRTVMVWDAESGRALNSFEGHSSLVLTVAWSPDGRRLASGSYDRTVKVWDAESGRALNSLEEHGNKVSSATWSPDGRRLASGAYDRTVKVWDAESGRTLNSLEGHSHLVLAVAWSPDGRLLASGSSDSTVKVWDAESGRTLNSLEGHGNVVYSVAWSPDGRRLASGSSDSTVKVWDAESGRTLNSLKGHGHVVTSVAWSPDGRRLASGAYDRTVKVWDAESGRTLNSLEGHSNAVNSVVWSPDGRLLASGADDSTVKVWDAESGKTLSSFEGHGGWVTSVAWSPDGRLLASGSSDHTVKIWDAGSGRLFSALNVAARVTSLTWNPDGRWLAISFASGFNEIWDLKIDPPRPLARLYHLPGGLAATPDGYVSGSPEALEFVRFGDGWALYDLTDLPERYSPERVAAALSPVKPAPPPESPAAEPAHRPPKSPRSRNGKGPGRRSA